MLTPTRLPLLFSLFVIVYMLSCSEEGHAQNAADFSPLKAGEILRSEYQATNGIAELLFDRIGKSGKKLGTVYRASHVDAREASLAKDSRLAYFVAFDQTPEAQAILWVVDGITGHVYSLAPVSPGFAVSEDGQYICYQDLQFQAKENSSTPRLTLYDATKRNVIRSIDFTDPRYRDCTTTIQFDSKIGKFKIEFDAEDRVMGEEYLALK